MPRHRFAVLLLLLAVTRSGSLYAQSVRLELPIQTPTLMQSMLRVADKGDKAALLKAVEVYRPLADHTAQVVGFDACQDLLDALAEGDSASYPLLSQRLVLADVLALTRASVQEPKRAGAHVRTAALEYSLVSAKIRALSAPADLKVREGLKAMVGKPGDPAAVETCVFALHEVLLLLPVL